jgi:Tol biopolymer transport system component/imidazolonepropionase-like amidohydrolase
VTVLTLAGWPSPRGPAAGAAPDPTREEEKEKKLDVNAVPKDARRVEFTTDEGTWISVDVSPDGKTVLFDLLGDLYRIPITGGRATRITSGPAFDYAPRISPDGKSVVFCSDRGGNMNLWLMDPGGGGLRPLTEEKDAVLSSPEWTPDGRYVLARKEETSRAGIPPVELWMYHRDGGAGIKVIPKDKLNNVGGPVASPDGKYVYVTGRERRFSYLPRLDDGLWNLYRFDRRTSDLHRLTPGPYGGLRPILSPDGGRLAYVRREDARVLLVIRDLNTGGEKVLVTTLSRDEQEGFAQMDVFPGADFTPDGKGILLWSGGKIRRVDSVSGRMEDVPFQADVSLDLRPLLRVERSAGEPELKVRMLRHPTLSPDGSRAAFEALGKIWVVDLAGGKAGKPRRLTRSRHREYAPVHSPDGRWIAFVSWSDEELGNVWKIRAGGGSPVRLTRRAGHYASPAWSPRGDRLAFVAGSGAELRGQQPETDPYYEIRWVPAEGGPGGSDSRTVTSVSPVEALRFHPTPAWSREGDRIFFGEAVPPEKPDTDGKTDLVSVRLDGSDKRRHLRFRQAEGALPSPDGEWVAYVRADDVYVTAMPRAGEGPVEIGFGSDPVPVYRLSTEGGGYLGWADGGRTVVWGSGPVIHRQDLAKVREAALAEAEAKRKEPAPAEKPPKLRPEAIPVTLVVPKPRPSGSVLLKNARVIPMRGNEVLERADILVTGNRIAALGAAGSVPAPAGSAVFDLEGKTVIPGLVDVHAHLHYSAFEIFPEKKWEYVANLAYGVTTTHDPSAHSVDVFAEGELVEAGEMIGPRIYSSGDVLYGGGQAAQYARVDGFEDAWNATRRMKSYGAHWLKVYQQPRRDQRIWFVEAARREGVGATMEGAGELHTDITNLLDGYTGLEHSLPVPVYRDVVTLAARSGTAYTPTLLVSYGGPAAELYWYERANPHDDARLRRFTPHEALDTFGRRRPHYPEDDYHFPAVAEGAARIAREGGRVCLGAHGQLQGLGAHWEMWSFARGGMTPLEALRTATWSGAEALGFGNDLGSIEPGKLADLVVIDGDPLSDIRISSRVAYTMKDGVLYNAATMDQVWPEKRALGRFFWQR